MSCPTTIRFSVIPRMRPRSTRSSRVAAELRVAAAVCWSRGKSRARSNGAAREGRAASHGSARRSRCARNPRAVDAEDAVGADLLIEDLRAEGMAVRDGFLGSSTWRALAACAATRRGRGDFAAARVGAGRALERREEIRGDFTCWLTPPLFEPEVRLLEMLERLRLELTRGGSPGVLQFGLPHPWDPPP